MRRETGARRTWEKVWHATPVGRIARGLGLAAALAVPMSGCSKPLTAGQSSSFIIIDALQASSGAEPNQFGGVLSSDVLTLVKAQIDGKEVRVPTIFADNGRVTFRLALKDPGGVDSPTVPSPSNFVTLNRYRVEYVRSDGRNAPGVDVPYPFDGATTITVRDAPITADFNIVRAQAKDEAPLKPLVSGGGASFISTIAHVTFFGADQTGRAVTVSGDIGVNFADWGDPE